LLSSYSIGLKNEGYHLGSLLTNSVVEVDFYATLLHDRLK